MNEIIKLTTHTIDGETQQTVCGRELHAALESKRDYSGWAKYQIERAGFLEGVDYVKTQDLSSPNLGNSKSRAQIRIEYHFTISAAKEIAMMSGSAKGKEVRLYFIQCEKELKEVKQQTPTIPQTLPEALRLAADLAEKNLELENKVKADAPKVGFAETVEASDGDMLIREAAKTLGYPVRKLFDWLRQHKWINMKNEPYADRVKEGLLRPCISSYEHPDKGTCSSVTSHVTPKGLFRIYKDLLVTSEIQRNEQLELAA